MPASQPRLQVDITEEDRAAFEELGQAGYNRTAMVAALAAAWRRFHAKSGDSADPKTFMAALADVGAVFDPAHLDTRALYQEAYDKARREALDSLVVGRNEAVLVGITATLACLLDGDDNLLAPEDLEVLVYRWFEEQTRRLRGLLAADRHLRDLFSGAAGWVCGESSVGARYIHRIMNGEDPGVRV